MGNKDEEELSKLIAYSNGDIMDIAKVRQALYTFWRLNKVEKRAFTRMIQEPTLQEKYKSLWED